MCGDFDTSTYSHSTRVRLVRKKPRQQRSRETVDILLDATASCLVTRGLAGTTTNHIAEIAGVSVGSLYQYFDDKEALVDALLDRMGGELRDRFSRRAEAVDIDSLSLRSIAQLAITYGLHRIRTDKLFREIVENWSSLPIDKILRPLEHYFVVRAHPYFLARTAEVPVRHLEAKLYVLVSSTLMASLRYVSDERPSIPEHRFVETLTDMIVALFEYDSGPPRTLPPSAQPSSVADANSDGTASVSPRSA